MIWTVHSKLQTEHISNTELISAEQEDGGGGGGYW